jgi:hypothetical protein
VRWFSGIGTAVLGSLEVGASARSATVTGLTSGAAHTFDVSATGPAGAGTVSQRSAQVTPTANAARPGKVRIGKAQAGAAGGTVTATARWTRWTSSAVTGYGVTALGLNAQGGVVSRTVSALLPPAGAASA